MMSSHSSQTNSKDEARTDLRDSGGHVGDQASPAKKPCPRRVHSQTAECQDSTGQTMDHHHPEPDSPPSTHTSNAYTANTHSTNTSVMPEHEKENTAGARTAPDTTTSTSTSYRREQPRKNHRKSLLPSHIGDSQRTVRMAGVAPGDIGYRERDVSPPRGDVSVRRAEAGNSSRVGARKGEDELLRFAEILYKCSLCTSLPCILTSHAAFLEHVRTVHLTVKATGYPCNHCRLRFDTYSDLQAHLSAAHPFPETESPDTTASDIRVPMTAPESCARNRTSQPSAAAEREHQQNSPYHDDNNRDAEDSDDPSEGPSPSQASGKDRQRWMSGSRRSSGEDLAKADVKHHQASVSPRFGAPQCNPLAGLDYRPHHPHPHPSVQHMHRLQALSSGPSSLSPPHHVDPSRSPLPPMLGGAVGSSSTGVPGAVPPEVFNGFPSFTHEFGRYTKLIREGGKIVYFCQACNVKCQVKVSFQVHCNGARHHNAVTLVSKNKVPCGVSHTVMTSRDVSVRSPLKEVPLMTPQLTSSPRGDHSFVEKMNRFLHDHPDLSSIINNGSSLSDAWGASPVNFSVRDVCGVKADSEDPKQPEKDGPYQADRRPNPGNNFCLETRGVGMDLSPAYQEEERNTKKQANEQCTANSRPGSDNWERVRRERDSSDSVARSEGSESRSRKRPASSSESSSSDTEIEAMTPPVTLEGCAGNGRNTDSADTDCEGSSQPTDRKRPRMDAGKRYASLRDSYESSSSSSSAAERHQQYSSMSDENRDGENVQSKKTTTASSEEEEEGRKQHSDSSRRFRSEMNSRSGEEKSDEACSQNLSNGHSVSGERLHSSNDVDASSSSDSEGASAAAQGRQQTSPQNPNNAQGSGVEPAALSPGSNRGAERERRHDKSTTEVTSDDTRHHRHHHHHQHHHHHHHPHRHHNEGNGEMLHTDHHLVTIKTEPGLELQPHQDGNHLPPGATADSSSPLCSNVAGDTHLPDQAFLSLIANQHYPVNGGSGGGGAGACFFPALLSDVCFRPDVGKDSERPLWGVGGRGVMSLPLHEADDVTDNGGGKGPNSEGWKVTKIRDVLRGLISASTKSSSVSRDVLLHRVSHLLQAPDVQHWGPACNRAVRDLFPHCLAQRKGKFKKTYFFGLTLIPAMEESKGEHLVHVDGTSFRPLRDMTQDLEQLLEHLPGLLCWSGQSERGVSRDCVLHVLAATLSEAEVFHWGMQCNKALRMLFPHVHMKRKGKYKTVYFGVDFTPNAQKLLPTLGFPSEQAAWQDIVNNISS